VCSGLSTSWQNFGAFNSSAAGKPANRGVALPKLLTAAKARKGQQRCIGRRCVRCSGGQEFGTHVAAGAAVGNLILVFDIAVGVIAQLRRLLEYTSMRCSPGLRTLAAVQGLRKRSTRTSC
jgi:hypothetical protein